MKLLRAEEEHATQLLELRAKREAEAEAAYETLRTLGTDVSQHLLYLQTMWHDTLRQSLSMSNAAIASLQTMVEMLTEAVSALDAEVSALKSERPPTSVPD